MIPSLCVIQTVFFKNVVETNNFSKLALIKLARALLIKLFDVIFLSKTFHGCLAGTKILSKLVSKTKLKLIYSTV